MSYEFGAHPSFVGPAAGEGPVYRRMSRTMTLPDAAAPGLLPVYRKMASLPSMPEVSASSDSMLPKLAKQNAFCSSKHDDAAAAVPARGPGRIKLITLGRGRPRPWAGLAADEEPKRRGSAVQVALFLFAPGRSRTGVL